MAPLPHCPNRNVFSDRRNSLYDMSASSRCDGRLFHSPGPEAPNALSPKVLYVRVTTHVRLAVERNLRGLKRGCSWGGTYPDTSPRFSDHPEKSPPSQPRPPLKISTFFHLRGVRCKGIPKYVKHLTVLPAAFEGGGRLSGMVTKPGASVLGALVRGGGT